jgi:coatomer subunit alpha
MLVKFESKSNRVKGIAFHPTRPWVLASLHNGAIQLWDIRVGTLIDRFDEHEGPVRGIHFHPTQPLFVSGGDDYKIKVFNYKLRRCIFTLIGHLDYIRTVYFHHESPWIVSASDDQTVRLWNWQNRSCLAVLTGHSHYVMSAQFSPNEDLVVSASLDQTVRCWDISSLRQKSVRPTDVLSQVRGQLPAAVNADLFGSSDAVVKYVLEGHSRGVNWASFHPTLPLIISGADDRQVKLWRMSDTKAWELDTFRGHLNNVSCAIFHPQKELVISNSEDRTIRVWDLNRRTCLHTFRRETDRFWIMAAHPTINLLAAGHDSGLLVFKLERERPAFQATDLNLVYVKDRFLRILDFNNGRDMPLVAVRQATGSMFDGMSAMGLGGLGGPSGFGGVNPMMLGMGAPPIHAAPARSMSYNPAEHAVLLNYDTDGGSFELYTSLPRSGSNGAENLAEPRRGSGTSAVFVGRNRFATLEKGKEIIIRDLRCQVTKRMPVSVPGANGLLGAGSGYVLVRSDEKVVLHDLQQRRVVGEWAATAKHAVWSEDMKRVALLGRHVLVLCTSRLEHLATVHETIRIKSAAWDDSGVLLYTTLNHLKYCLPNGDNGIVSTLQQPVYLTRVRGPAVCYLDREGNPGILPIDPTEYAFKLLLLRKRYDDVKRMISQNRLRGQSIIAYLHQKGFPEVALHFVRDEKTRLALALDSGAINIALEAAQALNEPDAFRQLADEALMQGDLEVVEKCLQKVKDMDRLAFLYVLTGNFNKLATVGRIAQGRGNLAAYFQIAMYLGDVEGRIEVLKDCGQGPLAKLTASSHGLEDVVDLSGINTTEDADRPSSKPGQLLMPPVPVGAGEMSWPQLPIARGLFTRDPGAEGAFEEPTAGDYYEDAAAFEASERDTAWDDDSKDAARIVDPFAVGLGNDAGAPGTDEGGGGEDVWGGDFDIADAAGDSADINGTGEGEGAIDEFGGYNGEATQDEALGQYYVPPTEGPGISVRWTRSSSLPGELAASGAFEEAMALLVRQIGVASFDCLKDAFLACYVGSRASLEACPNMTGNVVFLSKSSDVDLPSVSVMLSGLRERFRAAQQKFQVGRFGDAAAMFSGVLAYIPLLVLDTAEEEKEARQFLELSREYMIGLKLESESRNAKAQSDTPRQIQLMGLFSRCGMSPVHVQLALRAVMKTSYDSENFALAAGFARRLLELSPAPQLSQSARKVMQVCDRNMTNKDSVDYDERREFIVDCGSLTPMYAGSPRASCPYCGAHHGIEFAERVCAICGIGRLGAMAEGLRLRR